MDGAAARGRVRGPDGLLDQRPDRPRNPPRLTQLAVESAELSCPLVGDEEVVAARLCAIHGLRGLGEIAQQRLARRLDGGRIGAAHEPATPRAGPARRDRRLSERLVRGPLEHG